LMVACDCDCCLCIWRTIWATG